MWFLHFNFPIQRDYSRNNTRTRIKLLDKKLKFTFSERPQEFDAIFLQVLTLLSSFKTLRMIAPIFLVFSEKLNFTEESVQRQLIILFLIFFIIIFFFIIFLFFILIFILICFLIYFLIFIFFFILIFFYFFIFRPLRFFLGFFLIIFILFYFLIFIIIFSFIILIFSLIISILWK